MFSNITGALTLPCCGGEAIRRLSRMHHPRTTACPPGTGQSSVRLLRIGFLGTKNKFLAGDIKTRKQISSTGSLDVRARSRSRSHFHVGRRASRRTCLRRAPRSEIRRRHSRASWPAMSKRDAMQGLGGDLPDRIGNYLVTKTYAPGDDPWVVRHAWAPGAESATSSAASSAF
jgi:hypothetical protein